MGNDEANARSDDEATIALNPGDVIAGKYRLTREIARGGMGVIWAARHEMLEQDVAIKMLHGATLKIPNAIERFTREARASARLKSDHVVRVFDVGVVEESGLPYIAMEHLDGHDLAAELDERGAVPPMIACDYIMQALEAIIEAHAAGIVHRDLKPSNLFLARRTNGHRVKVLDFGISKIQNETKTERDLTSDKAILGSPAYMSPEQIRNAKNVDERTDIWALGVILHELLTGHPLFDGDGAGEIFSQVIADPIPAPSARRPDVPEGLDRVVMQCLERNLDARMPNVVALREALAPFAPVGSMPASVPSVRVVQTFAQERALVESDPTLDAVKEAPAPIATPRRFASSSIEGVVSSPGQHATRRRVLAGTALIACAAVAIALFVMRPWQKTVATTTTPSATAIAAEPPPSIAPIASVIPAASSVAPVASLAIPSATTPAKRPGVKPRGVAPRASGIAPPLVGRE